MTGDLIDTLITGFDFEVNSVAIGRAGGRDIIISGSGDAKVRVWDAVTGGILRHFDHDTAVNSVAIGWARDRDIIISGSNDRSILVRRHYPRR